MNPFDFVNAINYTKKDLMTGSENDELVEKEYVPFLVNKSLSYFPDTILYANEINRYNNVDKKLQFHYLLNSIRPQKRFAKWVKKVESEDISAVSQYYKYNVDKASQVLSILSAEQLETIKQELKKVNDDHYRRSY
jgi:hypothetical protein